MISKTDSSMYTFQAFLGNCTFQFEEKNLNEENCLLGNGNLHRPLEKCTLLTIQGHRSHSK